MPEDIVYSDVKFQKSNEIAQEPALAPPETTYAEVNVPRKDPSRERSGPQQQAPPNGGSKVTAERGAIAILTVLLAAALIACVFLSLQNTEAAARLQQLVAENQNLTETQLEINTCNKVPEFCTQPATQPCPLCEKDWEQLEAKCYNFSSSPSTWQEAREECQQRGGDLVQIDSREEQSFLARRLAVKMDKPEDKFWIGLTDSQEEKKWLWPDGSELNQSLTFWSAREPDNWDGENPKDGEDCVRMGEIAITPPLTTWFDKSCTIPHRSICEKPATKTGKLTCVPNPDQV